jgi:rSAM/selenodomain-associated transferase 1
MTSLIVFAKAPVEGKVKTRLGRAIGAPAARALYAAFLEDVCALAGAIDTRRILAVEGGLDHPELQRLALENGMEIRPQGPGTLGDRMQTALESALPACILGTDAPTVPQGWVEEALAQVSRQDAVVGPSIDGGYWLIGLSRPIPELFRDVPWSTPEVLPLTLERLRGRRATVLPYHHDVDEEPDLRLLAAHLGVLPHEVAPATRAAMAAIGRF